MASGGRQPGAGRPKKVGHTQPLAPAVNTAAKRQITARLMDQVQKMQISPLEVMLNTMKLHYDQGQTALKEQEVAKDKDQRDFLMRVAKAEMNASSSVAEKVAPYIHAKLQAVTLKGDKENPLEFGVNLRGLTDAELAQMQVLMAKAIGE